MSDQPACPACESEYTYQDGALMICSICAHEWNPDNMVSTEKVYRDVNGNVLADGDMVTLIKDLKVRGTSKTVKVGTRVKIGRLVDEDHDIDCKIDGFGAMKLKTEFVKKSG